MTPREQTARVLVTHESITVAIGGGAPVVVQSMTNTATEDVTASVNQVVELARAGSEIVRLTVNTPEAARAVPKIREALDCQGCFVPLVGDFHYNGHKLLRDESACARALSKWRMNPGNVREDAHFSAMIEMALKFDKPVRIGVNGGSIDMALLDSMKAENAVSRNPLPFDRVFEKALALSALQSASRAKALGMPETKIVLSAKVSDVFALSRVYRDLSEQTNAPLHVGLTEAGLGLKGLIATTAALSSVLNDGIGDTIRVSVTPAPDQARTEEVRIAREILQNLAIRYFYPSVTSCPGCGRTSGAFFQALALEIRDYLEAMTPVWKEKASGFEAMRVAVMGCVVNGPGEAKGADIGISLPGASEHPSALIFEGGRPAGSVTGSREVIAQAFKERINAYVLTHYAKNKE